MHQLSTCTLLTIIALLNAFPWRHYHEHGGGGGGAPLGPPPDQGLPPDQYVLAFCDVSMPGTPCPDIAAKINASPDAHYQAQVQRRYCFEGYKACKMTSNARSCNDALGHCMVGAWGCNAGGAAHTGQNPAVPEPGTSNAVMQLLPAVCQDNGDGSIGCGEIGGQVNTNHFSRHEAETMMNPSTGTGFCFDAYHACKGQQPNDGGAWDSCNNSLSRCLVGSWACNANGPPGGGDGDHFHHHDHDFHRFRK